MLNKKTIVTIIVITMIVVVSSIRNFWGTKETIKNQTNINEVLYQSDQEEKVITNLETIKVHIVGEVNQPGLIELEVGSRIQDAIELAGGLTQDADTSKTNLAYILSDGEKIRIPNINDEEMEENEFLTQSKININTASVVDLQTIPGVGESTANSIVEYRAKTGKFMSIDEIKNVSGIGESKFEKMQDYISVK